MKIATIIGARPQFIKSAVFSRLVAQQAGVEETVIHTGQHYSSDMSELFFSELEIPPPAFNLQIGSSSHGIQTGRMLQELAPILERIQPDVVLVYGDTNSTLAGAIAAAKMNIKVAHVEAGLRSFNRSMPEEINRVLTDHVSSFLFAPTDAAVTNLLREGVESSSIHQVGDIMYDAVLTYAAEAGSKSKILEKHGLASGSYILATIHRAENTASRDRLEVIFNSLAAMATEHRILVPLHPRTKAVLATDPDLARVANSLTCIDPVGYLDMQCLEKSACLIVTDSGGVQKEAFFHRVPCVTVRDETEWVELVEAGWNWLAPPADVADVVTTFRKALKVAGNNITPYGDGHSAEKILKILLDNEKS